MIKFSEETVEIFKALSSFQKEVKQPKKDADNPFFKSKYVPLENVVEVIHEAASKHGLSEMTYPAQEENAVGVGVIITHSSGQYIKFPPILLKPDKNTPQGIGAAITYARRYALSSAFGIASETDDDANSISGNGSNQNNKEPNKASDKQLGLVDNLLNKNVNEKFSKADLYAGLKKRIGTTTEIENWTSQQASSAIKILQGDKK